MALINSGSEDTSYLSLITCVSFLCLHQQHIIVFINLHKQSAVVNPRYRVLLLLILPPQRD
jgi:hypothetical protein